ncbi:MULTISPECIES: chaplin [unclassified Streptomyces]|uniref:chaplin n=1 Tax=unclassified Streptomyces TaxID=2593676 RepID=UPI00367B59ED
MFRIAKAVVVSAVIAASVVGTAGAASADAGAVGVAAASPGIISGNVVQVPVHVPINICGNSVNIIALLNPAFGNVCVNA